MGLLALFALGSCVFAYMVGSIPFGLILTKKAGYGDIRKIGSGNTGATNVLRTGNKKLALATLLLDGSKGILVIFSVIGTITLTQTPYSDEIFNPIANVLFSGACLLGLFAVIGHCYPFMLKFKGGKGVATTLGTLLVAVPYAGLAACTTWLLIALIFRISSLAALIAVAIAPVVALFFYGITPAGICTLITLLIWIRHKENIKRLLKGEEPKIGSKKKGDTKEEKPI